MKTIIHATDFSKNAITALKYAYAFSEKINASLWVVNIFDANRLSSNLNEPYPFSKKELKTQKVLKIKQLCIDHLGSNFLEKKIHIEAIENSSVVNGIISKTDELYASLIITGMKGKSDLKDFLMGNTTKILIEKAPCPVLAIPEKAVFNNIDTIVYASDFEQEDISAIYRIVEITKKFNTKIKIIHVSTKKENNAEEQMQWFKEMLEQKVSYKNIEYALFYSDDVFNFLKIYLTEKNADWVAMLERKKKGLVNKLFHSDLVKKMKDQSDVPLISFNEFNYSRKHK
ncbi:universal stress protein [uncultured Lutibacter sp.]|uniref:universal stress protein n=1 Tax=uncultured Lutibacter sp. TaxID=437739 RepID=UPI0026164D14|nr:universal stress protein [uncultured Lutibacter sp.]